MVTLDPAVGILHSKSAGPRLVLVKTFVEFYSRVNNAGFYRASQVIFYQ